MDKIYLLSNIFSPADNYFRSGFQLLRAAFIFCFVCLCFFVSSAAASSGPLSISSIKGSAGADELQLPPAVKPSLSHISSETTGFADLERTFSSLVNYARAYPVETASILGMNADKIFSGVPSFDPLWRRDQWLLHHSSQLSEASRAHASEILSSGTNVNLSDQGNDIEARILSTGYPLLQADQYTTFIVPQAYVSPEQALLELFVRFFEDESRAYSLGQASVFDQRWRDIGVSYSAGQIQISGSTYKVYLLVVTYGLSRDSFLEDELMRRINTARQDYADFLKHYEIDTNELSRRMNDFLIVVMGRKLPQVLFNRYNQDYSRMLFTASSRQMESFYQDDMLATYEVQVPAELPRDEIGQMLFQRLLFIEEMTGVRLILNPWARTGLISVSRDKQDEQMINFRVTVAVRSASQNSSYVQGTLVEPGIEDKQSHDSNFKDHYVWMEDSKGNRLSYTLAGESGYFMLSRPAAGNVLRVVSSSGTEVCSVNLDDTPTRDWLYLECTP